MTEENENKEVVVREKTKLEVLSEQTKEFCFLMCQEMGENPEEVVEGRANWMKYLPMATDHFLNEAYGRVRNVFWDREKAKNGQL